MKPTLPHSLKVGSLLFLLLFCLPFTLVGKSPELSRVMRYVPDAPPEHEENRQEWVFSADRVSGDHTSEYIEAFGNCSLTLGENQLRADFIRYYQSTGWAYVKGNITAHWGGDFLQAEEGEFDLTNLTGWLKNGKLFMAKPHIYVEAERVGKAKGDSYSFKNAKITACDGERPAWSVSAEEGDIQLDGRVKLYRSAFRIKDVPVFYWPYMSLPGRQERESGFLTPYLSSSSKLGVQVNLPYYWVINDEADVTLYQNYMSRRGYMQGVELRHTDDTSTRGVWKFDYLNDKKRARSEIDEWEDYQDDGLTRPNRSRWWMRSKFDGWLGSPHYQVKLDLDVVSDQNYLRDFQYGPNGFEKTREEFLDKFGRDIANKDDTIRTSTALLSRSWDRFGASAKGEYNQNLAYWNGNNRRDRDPTVQTLPELEAFAFQQNIPGTPLEVSADTKYDYFTRRYGHKGHRVRVTPEVKLPMGSKYFSFIPKVGGDYTGYKLSRLQSYGTETVYDSSGREVTIDSTKVQKRSNERLTWFAGFDSFSEMTRVYAPSEAPDAAPDMVGVSRWTRLKHSVIPRVKYQYTPTITGQDEFPYFDEYDRIEGANAVTYSLTNVLDRRRDSVALSPGSKDGPEATVVSDYLDFFLFRLEQSYDINEANRMNELAQYRRRPFSDVLTEFKIKPENYIDLISRTWFSPYRSKLTQSEHSIRLYDETLGEISLGYDYLTKIDEYKRQRDETMSILKLDGKWLINDQFALGGRYRHDFRKDKMLESAVTLDWNAGCYTLHFAVIRKLNDSRFELGFDLVNF